MSTKQIKVAFLLADYGCDPTETAIPWQVFTRASFQCTFITETGAEPATDSRMISGITGALLGAASPAKAAYHSLTQSPEWRKPLSWSDPSITLDEFDLLFLPGGHDKCNRQLLDSARAQELVANFWPGTSRDSSTGGKCKVCAAVCHGVQLLAHTKVPDGSGKSVLHDVHTTALTGVLENAGYWSTRLVLGDYYKTYGAGTANVEDVVKGALDDATKQWSGPANPFTPFVAEDQKYNYLSARWPADVPLLAERTVELVKRVVGEK